VRIVLLTLGALGSAVVVATVGYFGFISSADPMSRGLAAAWNCGIALGALGGLAAVQRAWHSNRAAALFYGAIWLGLVAINVGNSIGFLAVKGEKQDATASHAASTLDADKTTLNRKQDERARLRFEQTTAAQVGAAERAADYAKAAADQECGRTVPKALKSGPGGRCEGKDKIAATANAEYVRLIGEKAKSDSAAKLDDEIDQLRGKIAAATPETGSADSAQGAAFARIINSTGWFQVTALDAESWRHFGLAMAFELLIICCFSAAELFHKARMEPSAVPRRPALRLPSFPRPRLIRSSETPALSVLEFGAKRLDAKPGANLDFDNFFREYETAASAAKLRALRGDDFIKAFNRLCSEAGIYTRRRGNKLMMPGVALTGREEQRA